MLTLLWSSNTWLDLYTDEREVCRVPLPSFLSCFSYVKTYMTPCIWGLSSLSFSPETISTSSEVLPWVDPRHKTNRLCLSSVPVFVCLSFTPLTGVQTFTESKRERLGNVQWRVNGGLHFVLLRRFPWLLDVPSRNGGSHTRPLVHVGRRDQYPQPLPEWPNVQGTFSISFRVEPLHSVLSPS